PDALDLVRRQRGFAERHRAAARGAVELLDEEVGSPRRLDEGATLAHRRAGQVAHAIADVRADEIEIRVGGVRAMAAHPVGRLTARLEDLLDRAGRTVREPRRIVELA